jgi:hypothetical protein
MSDRARKFFLTNPFYSVMPQGRCWRIAALVALATSLMAGTASPAIGLELPSVQPLTSAAPAPAPQTTSLVATTPQLPSVSVPPVPALPSAPTLPASPQLIPSSPGPTTGGRSASDSQAPAATTRASASGQVRKRQRSRSERSGKPGGRRDAGSAPRVAGGGALRAERASRGRASGRTGGSETGGILPLIFGNPVYQVQSGSPFGQLGTPVEQTPVSRLVRSFGDNSTTGAAWAPPLLAIMLLIGLGGFLRAARWPGRPL